jgi:hypothetical protein
MILDSRGFVLLRLGRAQDAIAQYDAALAVSPDKAPSLYGRAVAEARIGDKAASARDLAAAQKADAGVVDRFTSYGVTVDGAASKPVIAATD